MSKKFEIIGNALVVTDTVTSKREVDTPTSAYYDKNFLADDYINIVGKNPKGTIGVLFSQPISVCVDSSLTPFTAETFETFARTFLGFSSAGSTALQTNNFIKRVLGDGGTVEAQSCVRKAYIDSIKSTPGLMVIPSAYKPEVCYAQIPEPVYGPELVTNGGFDTDTDWTLTGTFTISNGLLNCVSDGTLYQATQPLITEIGKTYKVELDVSDWLSGEINLGDNIGNILVPLANGNGHIKTTFIAPNNGTTIRILRSVACDMKVDNFSVKEVIVGDGDGTVDRDCEAYRTNEQGLLEAVPNDVIRVDYADGGCPVILTETQSTNLYLNSQAMATQNVTTSASSYTVSFYGTGTITLSGSFVGSLVGTGANDLVQLTFTATVGTLTSTISGTVDDGQCENLGYATSRIRTLGTTVTRLKDVVTDFGNVDTFNSEEGVLYVDIAALSNSGTNRLISISDGTTSNVVIIYYSTTANRIVADIKSGGVTSFFNNYTGISDVTKFTQVALKWKLNDFAFYIDGVEVGSDVLGNTPIGLSELSLDNGLGADLFFGKTRAIKVYKSIEDASYELPYL